VIFDHFPEATAARRLTLLDALQPSSPWSAAFIRGTTPGPPMRLRREGGRFPVGSGPGLAGGVVLPQQSRMKSPEEFKRTLRSGRRAGGVTLSGHLLLASGQVPSCAVPKVGFVVSRAVGSAVVRNRVKRRLRELMRGRVASLPGGCLLVLRAHPAAAGVRQADLAADLDLVLGRLLRRQVGALRQ